MEPPKQIKPSKERPWPVFWVRELLILRELKQGDEFVLRRISMRLGINILWSKAAEGSDSEKLFKGGFSGHTSGKTTFCRLLRYVLGEGTFGDESLRNSIRTKFPKGWIAAEVIILGKPWLVCRPLGIGPHSFAYRDTTLDRLFDQDLHRENFDSYLQALDDAVKADFHVKTLASSGEPLKWPHVMPWLTRDQECRYANLLDWRDPTSESRSPHLEVLERQFIVRTVLGLLSDDELHEIENNNRLLGELKRLRERRPLLAYQATEDQKRLEESLGCRLPPLDDGLFGEIARKKLQERTARIENIKDSTPLESDIDEAQETLENAIRRETEAKRNLKDAQDRLRIERTRLRAISQEMTDEERRRLFASLPPARGYCNIPIEVAKEQGCPMARTRPLDLGIARAERTLPEQKRKLEQVIEMIEKDVKEKLEILEACRKDTASARHRLHKIRLLYNDKIQRIAKSEEESKQLELLARRAEMAWQKSKELERRIDELENEIKKSKEKQRKLRDQRLKALNQFSKVFDYIVRAIVGGEVTTSAKFSSRGIDFRIDYHGERKSAAIETIKTLCFDLAALTSSIQGHGFHPRFLIHDSPREADMAHDVYRRFFILAKELENCFSSNRIPNFQYIVTTTEPPPLEMLKKPWLLDPVLDGSQPETRLLGVDL